MPGNGSQVSGGQQLLYATPLFSPDLDAARTQISFSATGTRSNFGGVAGRVATEALPPHQPPLSSVTPQEQGGGEGASPE